MADQWTATPQGAMGPLGAQDRPMFGNPALGRKLNGGKSKIMTVGLPVALAALVVGGAALVMANRTSKDDTTSTTTTTVATQTTPAPATAPMPVATAAATPFAGPVAPPSVTIPSERERLAVNPPARVVTRHVAQARRAPAAASAHDAAADVSAVIPAAPPSQVAAPAPAPMVIDVPPPAAPAPQPETPAPQPQG